MRMRMRRRRRRRRRRGKRRRRSFASTIALSRTIFLPIQYIYNIIGYIIYVRNDGIILLALVLHLCLVKFYGIFSVAQYPGRSGSYLNSNLQLQIFFWGHLYFQQKTFVNAQNNNPGHSVIILAHSC